MLLDKVGQGETAIDYATGALVNAQVRTGMVLGVAMCTSALHLHPRLHPPALCVHTHACTCAGP